MICANLNFYALLINKKKSGKNKFIVYVYSINDEHVLCQIINVTVIELYYSMNKVVVLGDR